MNELGLSMTDFGSGHTSQVFKAEAQAQSLPATKIFLEVFLVSKTFLRLLLPWQKCSSKTQELDMDVKQLSMDLRAWWREETNPKQYSW